MPVHTLLDGGNMDQEEKRESQIKKSGQFTMGESGSGHRIHLLSIIGEIEGHDCLPATTKTTKYEHVLPQLAQVEDSEEYDGLLVLINSVGGDVESGLAIAEMIASISKPTVSLVLGGSHSIAVPLATATDYSFIVPTGTMVIHPVRMNGLFIGIQQTYDYFRKIQDRITGFVCSHCRIERKRLEELMAETGEFTKDVGSILVGKQTVEEGIIHEVGGISQALIKLHEMIENDK
jgi:ATP-dependent protease ClpP protease subunit